MIAEVAMSIFVAYSFVTMFIVFAGMVLGFLGSLKINESIFSWKFLEDSFSLITFISAIGLFWPLVVLFVGFLSVKYAVISQMYTVGC